MEGGDLRVVPLKVGEVKVVRQRLLAAVEPHRLEQCLATVLQTKQKILLFCQQIEIWSTQTLSYFCHKLFVDRGITRSASAWRREGDGFDARTKPRLS